MGAVACACVLVYACEIVQIEVCGGKCVVGGLLLLISFNNIQPANMKK